MILNADSHHPFSFSVAVRNNYGQPGDDVITDSLLYLKNETLISKVRGYRVGQLVAFTEEEHEALHGDLPNSNSEHPHVFERIPVRASVDDPDAPVVAIVAVGIALDAAMQNLDE